MTFTECYMLSVNALSGLLSFLLYLAVTEWLGDQDRVNALSGLLSFLHEGRRKEGNMILSGVNALSGLLSFLLRMDPICLSLCRSVSMP